MAVLPHPPKVPGSDKVLHVLAFASLALFATVAYPKASVWRLTLGLGFFGALIELVQLIPALNRQAELFDWFADIAAVLTVLVAVSLWRAISAAPARG